MAEVTIGGQRLGSGNNRKEELSHYHRSTFNQEQDFKSSLAPGILYPFLCIPMTLGDSMNIDLDAFVRTLPTKGPLFGSYKLQCDIFSIPMRLYQGILHNNPIDIGMNMKNVLFPKLDIEVNRAAKRVKGRTDYDWQIAPTSLMKYLGLSGIGYPTGTSYNYYRKINAIPALGYYDIFKNYYANKQEKNAYVITPGTVVSENESKITKLFDVIQNQLIPVDNEISLHLNYISESYMLQIEGILDKENISIYFKASNGTDTAEDTIDLNTLETEYEILTTTFGTYANEYNTLVNINIANFKEYIENEQTIESPTSITIQFKLTEGRTEYTSDIHLTAFELSNIDKMRQLLLSKNELGDEFIIGKSGDWKGDSGNDSTGMPYAALTNMTENNVSWNSFDQNGLVVKTYQSDLYNNWVQTEWIEGENGIGAITAVNVSEGTLEIDALILAKKVYDMLNRVALSGGTYEDWQEAVYTDGAIRKAETPIYEGGMSAEIMFEEVISNAETEVAGDFQALGSLGGKGTMIGQKGGHNIEIHAHEPIFVMGIVSITPRICYTQGNEWYITELDSFDDLHKPGLDQIGFQDLITEQMAWWDTHIVTGQIGPRELQKHSAGKVVAWSNYMTAVDKAFGDFAKPEGKGFMVLARNYEIDPTDHRIKDLTTYIDPAKYNYAFAYSDLASQNFWVQLHSKVITRRVMSAHQIPNL